MTEKHNDESEQSSIDTDREVIQYIERFGTDEEHRLGRIVKVEKEDTETGQVETHIGVEVKLPTGQWFYKHGIGRCIETETNQEEN